LLISGCSSKEPKIIVEKEFIEAIQYPFEIVTLEGAYIDLNSNILKNVEIKNDIVQSRAKSPIVYLITDGNNVVVSAKGVQRICSSSLYENDILHKKPFDFLVEQIGSYKATFIGKDNNKTKGDK
jgi:hypothetical protein